MRDHSARTTGPGPLTSGPGLHISKNSFLSPSSLEGEREGVAHASLQRFPEEPIEVRAEAELVGPPFEIRTVDVITVKREETLEVPALRIRSGFRKPPKFREDEVFETRDPRFAIEYASADSTRELRQIQGVAPNRPEVHLEINVSSNDIELAHFMFWDIHVERRIESLRELLRKISVCRIIKYHIRIVRATIHAVVPTRNRSSDEVRNTERFEVIKDRTEDALLFVRHIDHGHGMPSSSRVNWQRRRTSTRTSRSVQSGCASRTPAAIIAWPASYHSAAIRTRSSPLMRRRRSSTRGSFGFADIAPPS